MALSQIISLQYPAVNSIYAIGNLNHCAKLQLGKFNGVRMLDVDSVNTKASKMTIIGWIAGLAYYNWFSSSALHFTIWQHALLVVVGMFAASILIGGGIALLAAGLTKILTGKSDGSVHAFSWAALISPVIAFFAAKHTLLYFGS